MLRVSRHARAIFMNPRATGQAIKVPVPNFTKARHNARWNLCHEDRIKLYNWNLWCVAITAVPFGFMYCKNYDTSFDTQMIYNTMDPTGSAIISHDLNLFK